MHDVQDEHMRKGISAHHTVDVHAEGSPPGLNEFCCHLVFLYHILLGQGRDDDACME